jgi:hypothetical protein
MRQRLSTIFVCFWALALGACAGTAPPSSGSNRADGEGYAGRGDLVLRIGVPASSASLIDAPGLSKNKPERGSVELRYLGLDSLGRAVFQRHDSDASAGHPPAKPEPSIAEAGGKRPGTEESNGPDAPNTRKIALDLRLTRQIRIQGKIIEVIEATPSGVVFRLY